MDNKTIHARLDAMLEDPKAKNFLSHLVRSYMPVNKVEKVFDRPKGPFKCALTNVPLVSVQDIMEGINSDQFKEDFFAHLKSFLNEDSDRQSPMALLIGERKMGVTGKNTTTYLSVNAFQAFYDWIVTKLFQDNQTILYLLKSMQPKDVLKRAATIDNETVKSQVDAYNKKQEGTTHIATFSLGEIPALAKLRAQFND